MKFRKKKEKEVEEMVDEITQKYKPEETTQAPPQPQSQIHKDRHYLMFVNDGESQETFVIKGRNILSALTKFSREYEQAPSFLNSLRYTFKNKAFRKYILATFALWYAFGMLPTITPLYGSFVLGIDDSLILSLFLALAFISSAIFVFVWKPILKKYGAKKTYIYVLIVFIATLAPFMFISDMIAAFFAYFFIGIGLAGAFIIRDVTLSAIIDEDEINTGVRREGGFYGVHGFMIKLTNVFVFISIALVFNSVGWAVFDPVGTSEETIFGLRSLMFLFPAFFLVIGLIVFLKFPIDKEKYDSLTEETRKLHQLKKEKVVSS